MNIKNTVCVVGQFRGYFIVNALCILLPRLRPHLVMIWLVWGWEINASGSPIFSYTMETKRWKDVLKGAKKELLIKCQI